VLPVGPDGEVAKVLERALAQRGTVIHAEARVSPPERTEGGLLITFETPASALKIEVDQLLVAVGRRPVTDGLGLEEAGVEVDSRGFVCVDPATLQTARPGVYAVGDVIATPGLAHVAYGEAIVAITAILGEPPVPVDYGRVPWVAPPATTW
jgi:dihydrolipoamide dehydrogenase